MSTESAPPQLPPAVLAGLLQPAQTVINRLLSLDPAAGERLATLEGRSLEVRLTGLPSPVRVDFHGQGLTLVSLEDGEAPAADATLVASPAALATLALSNGERGGRDLEFRGDVGVIQDVRRLFRELDIDWEEQLSRLTGDVVAHEVGNAARGLQAWLQHAAGRFLDNAGEYLTEEQRALPASAEVEGFVSEVDRLRADADRLQARVKRLQQLADKEG